MTRAPFTVPWSADEVRLLQQHQDDPNVRPFTCSSGLSFTHHGHRQAVTLRPTYLGLVCPDCGRLRNTL